jgi:protein involved in polysaccharide export with SLBB domain
MPDLAKIGKRTSIATIFFCSILSSGCDHITPGMRMETHGMPIVVTPDARPIPVLIPITATIIRNQTNFSSYHYYVGPQDIINIQIWNHPEYNVPSVQTSNSTQTDGTQQNLILQQSVSEGTYGYGYLVAPDGRIFFPMIGDVPVSGLTVEEIRKRMTVRLSKYLRDPQVQVRVTSFRSKKIYVMGEVAKPGVQAITDVPLNITDAISMAGGMDATTSDPRHIYVIRGSIENPSVYWLNAKSPDALILASNFQLKHHDIVYVSAAPIVMWNRMIGQILPTIETIWYTNSLVTNR